MVISD